MERCEGIASPSDAGPAHLGDLAVKTNKTCCRAGSHASQGITGPSARELHHNQSQVIASHAFCKPRVLRSACCSRKASMSSWFSVQPRRRRPGVAGGGARRGRAAPEIVYETRRPSARGRPYRRLDGFVFVLFIAAQLALNWALRLIIARPLANFLLATPKRPTRALRRMVVKFSQACLELLVYGSFAVIGAIIVPSQPWFWPSKHWWIGFADGGHEVMRDDLRCYYLLYGGAVRCWFCQRVTRAEKEGLRGDAAAPRRYCCGGGHFVHAMDGTG